MKWTGAEVARDARRFAEAQLNYGKGSRINRRNLNIELERKMRDPMYREAFENELQNLDDHDIYIKLKAKKTLQSAYRKGKKVYRTANRFYRIWQKLKPYIYEVLK